MVWSNLFDRGGLLNGGGFVCIVGWEGVLGQMVCWTIFNERGVWVRIIKGSGWF